MNQQDFDKLVNDRCDKIKKTLASKGKEYSTDDDKLHNFNKAGVRTGQSRERALMGMKLKHEISIDDIIDKLDYGVNPSIEVIDEKIGDIINYFTLLEACLVDRLNKEERSRLREYPLRPEECIKTNDLKGRMNQPPDWGNLVGIKKEDKPSLLAEGQKGLYTDREYPGEMFFVIEGQPYEDILLYHNTIMDKNSLSINPKEFHKKFVLWKEDS